MPVVDFNVYQDPGVYVREEASSLVSVVGAAPTLPAIVGPSIGSVAASESINLVGTDGVELSKEGVLEAEIEVAALNGTVYAETTDYTVTTTNNVTTIARVDGGNIPDDSLVDVTYRYVPSDYSDPHRFSDYDDVREYYGAALDLDAGTITSPLTLAAKTCFENGATEIVLVDSASADAAAPTRQELQTAYGKLTDVRGVNIVVGLPVGSEGTDAAPGQTTDWVTDLANHVEQSSNLGDRRVGVIGLDTGVTMDPTTIAAGVASSRVMLAYPHTMKFYNGPTNQIIDVGGLYLAAAYAGRMATYAPSMPLTHKPVRGFSGVPTRLTRAVASRYSKNGVALTEQGPEGNLRVRHGVSTDPSNLMTREFSLTRQRDAMIQAVEDTVDGGGLIGAPIDDTTTQSVKSAVVGALSTVTDNGVIEGFKDVKVRQQSIDPSVIEVKFQYLPAYPLNYILIVFSVNVQTGELAEAA